MAGGGGSAGHELGNTQEVKGLLGGEDRFGLWRRGLCRCRWKAHVWKLN